MLHCIDRALWAVAPVVGLPARAGVAEAGGTGARAEAPGRAAGGRWAAAGLELHAQLIHHSSGAVIADALRGGVRVVAGDHVRFAELAVEHKPHSVAKKRSASLREEQASSNTYTLAFSLYNVRIALVRIGRSARHALRPQEFLPHDLRRRKGVPARR